MADAGVHGDIDVKKWQKILKHAADGQRVPRLTECIDTLRAELAGTDLRTRERAFTRIATGDWWVPGEALQLAEAADGTSDFRQVAAAIAAIGFIRVPDRVHALQAITFLERGEPAWEGFEAFCLHLRSLTALEASSSSLALAQQLSEEANRLEGGNAGMVHALATIHLESAIWNSSAPDDQRDHLVKANELVERAIELEDYPKFHFTRARIMVRLAELTPGSDLYEVERDAIREIDTAIGQEASLSADASARRNSYQAEKSRIELRRDTRQAMTQLRNSAEQARRAGRQASLEIRKSQVQMITVVAFITSLVALLQFGAALYVIAEKAGDTAQDDFRWLMYATAVMAIILLGGVILGASLLNRSMNTSSEVWDSGLDDLPGGTLGDG